MNKFYEYCACGHIVHRSFRVDEPNKCCEKDGYGLEQMQLPQRCGYPDYVCFCVLFAFIECSKFHQVIIVTIIVTIIETGH